MIVKYNYNSIKYRMVEDNVDGPVSNSSSNGYWAEDCTKRDNYINMCREKKTEIEKELKTANNTVKTIKDLKADIDKEAEKISELDTGFSTVASQIQGLGYPISSPSNMDYINSGCECVSTYKGSIENMQKKLEEKLKEWEEKVTNLTKDLEEAEEAYAESLVMPCEAVWVSF